MMFDILVAVILVGFPTAFNCFIVYHIGYAEGYYKAKVEEEEQSK